MERARSLDPNLAILWGGAGLISVCPGQPDVGIKQIEHAMRLSPLDPSMGLWQQGIALGHLYTGATKTQFCGQQCRCEMGVVSNTLATLAAGHAFLGNADEAQKAVAHLQSVEPGWRLSNLPDLRLVRQAQDRERFVEGLRRAGLPE
jgi:hypothetical protein